LDKLKKDEIMQINGKIPKSVISKDQTREFGMVTVLVTTFLAMYLKDNVFATVAFILVLITILYPIIFYPFAFCWFGIAKILGIVSSGILLTVVFLVIVVPIGVFRKIFRFDGLKLKQFKKSKESILINRDHVYTDADLLHTF
jgi:polyferredoxin